jgi:hypothetical protein
MILMGRFSFEEKILRRGIAAKWELKGLWRVYVELWKEQELIRA